MVDETPLQEPDPLEPPLEPGDRLHRHETLAGDPPPPGVQPVVVPRWVQLVVLPLAILALWVIARAAGGVLLLFVTAAVIALILNPLVRRFQRHARLPRGVAVAAVYLVLLLIVTGVGFLLANPIADQAKSLQRDVPNLVRDANTSIADFQHSLDKSGIHIGIVKPGKTAVQTIADKLGAASGNIASTATDLAKSIVTAALGIVLVIVLSVYMLLYGDRIGALVRRVMPPGDGTPEDDYPSRVQRAVSGYVRGQLVFSIAMGLGAGLGMWIFGVAGIFGPGRSYALAFGIFFGFMELVPFVGPVLGALPPVLVALFQSPLTGLWVALFFLALQQLEGHVVAPQIFGHTLRINPLLVIFALLLGGEVAGVLGALVALPLAAVVRETAIYLRRHLVLEPWGTTSPLPLGRPPPPEPPGRACPDCGTAAGAGDDFCRSCGAALTPPVIARR